MSPRSILVITGASGAGKTAIVSALSARPHPGIRYHHFDSVGVPTVEAMIAQYGSGEAWQTGVTGDWIKRLAEEPGGGPLDVLEGQVRPGIVQEAFETNRVERGKMLLLDCTPDVRLARLSGPRGQPELATNQMTAWAAYLRGQADALHLPVLDTSSLSLEQAVTWVGEHIGTLSLGAQ